MQLETTFRIGLLKAIGGCDERNGHTCNQKRDDGHSLVGRRTRSSAVHRHSGYLFQVRMGRYGCTKAVQDPTDLPAGDYPCLPHANGWICEQRRRPPWYEPDPLDAPRDLHSERNRFHSVFLDEKSDTSRMPEVQHYR